MEELTITGIMDANIGLLQANAIFAAGNIILLWMVFRGVTNANLYGANVFSKVIHTVMSLCIVLFNTATLGNISSQLNNWAMALSEIEGEMPGGLVQFIERMGATEYTNPGLVPENPVALIFWIAVTIGLVVAGKFSSELMIGYIIAQVLGAMLGSWLTYLFYIDHYRSTTDENKVMGSFCTSPAIRNFKNNFFSEFLATFILIFGILYIVEPNIIVEGLDANFGIGSLGALPVGILVWVIGLSLGGTTGYAINPARDLGPRIIYQLIPRKNKISDWAYSWIPIFGPSLGALVAGLLYLYFN